MKKALFMLALAVGAVACNNEGSGSGSLEDSVMSKIDSSADAKIDSIQETTDSVKERLGNTFDKMDSAGKAVNAQTDSATN